MALPLIKKKSLLILLPLLLWGAALDGREGNFSSYLRIFDYPGIKEKISPLELREMDRIVVTDRGISYPDKLIKLYLLASDITDEKTFNRYLNDFKSKLNKARKIIKEKGYDRKLNRYNLAEFLLHFLHTEYFFNEQKGSAAGYNIGIRETFDSGKFNCFKSALIYNAFLEYFGYRTSLISAPNHIYSLVNINGITISVETTNRYGFDPYNTGKGKYRKLFDKEDIIFGIKYYREKVPMDNISVVVLIYVHRSHLYSGEKYYPGIQIEKNYSKAAALSILSSFLCYSEKSSIIENLLFKVFYLSKHKIDKNPEIIDVEYRRFAKIIDHHYFQKYSRKHWHNIEAAVVESFSRIRERKLNKTGTDNPQTVLKLHIDEIESINSYIKKNINIRNRGWNNSIIDFNKIIKSKYDSGNLDNIKRYGRLIMEMINNPVFRNSGSFIKKYRDMYLNNISISINNLGIVELNKQNWREAHRIYREGLDFLQKELKINSGYYYRLIIEHYNYAKKNL
jgi:hypothetical protein